MNRKLVYSVLAALILIAGVYGAVNKQSYRRDSQSPGFYDSCYVGCLIEELVGTACDSMRQDLPTSNIILRVEPRDGLENGFMSSRQRFLVKEVFKGDTKLCGKEIYLTSSGWFVSPREEEWSTRDIIERDFVNIPQEGRDYLVFVDCLVDLRDSNAVQTFQVDDFYTFSKFIFSPLFCYDDIDNIVCDDFVKESTYVLYSKVSGNEFFAVNEQSLDKMTALKKEMISMYPAGSGYTVPAAGN